MTAAAAGRLRKERIMAKSKDGAKSKGAKKRGGKPLRLEWVRADTLKDNPRNWRRHPEGQVRALGNVLADRKIGWAGALLFNERTGRLIDGHARKEAVAADTLVPVLVGNWSAAAEKKILLTLDPLAAMAEADIGALEALMAEVNLDAPAMEALATELAELIEGGDDAEGYRPGEKGLMHDVLDWTGAEEFFECPDDVRQMLEGKKEMVVQFSGGKDSLCVLLWVRRNFPDVETTAVYVDTGVEFPGTGAYVREAAEMAGASCEIIKPKEEWWAWLASKGTWPSLIYRNCMQTFIHRPFGDHVRRTREGAAVAIFTGSRAEEAVRGSKKTATSSLMSLGAKAEEYTHYAPCFAVRKTEIYEVLRKSKAPLWPGYDRGFVRTACWCCPAQCGLQACALVDNYPGLAEDVRRWEKRLGVVQPLNGKNGKSFDNIVAAGRKKQARAAKKGKA